MSDWKKTQVWQRLSTIKNDEADKVVSFLLGEFCMDRIEKILLGACKQSLKLTIPKLNRMIKFEDFVSSGSGEARKFVAYCDEKSIHFKNAYHGNFDALIMIGPEGDFTKDEIMLAERNEFETVSLGKSRLRLETAGVFAASIFNLANES